MTTHRKLTRRIFAPMVILTVALALAACSSGSTASPATSTPVSPGSSGTTATTAAPSGGGGTFCGSLIAEQSSATTMETSMGQSIQSGNFAAAQSSFKSYFTQLNKDMTKVENTMGSAPADVQSALKVFNNWLQQVQAAISKATSMTGLEQAFVTLGNNANLKSASSTLDSYAKSQCGSTTATT